MRISGPEADGFHPGPAEPAGERHQADAQSHGYGGTAAERGEPSCFAHWFYLDIYVSAAVLLPEHKCLCFENWQATF